MIVPNHALRNLIYEARGLRQPVTLEEHGVHLRVSCMNIQSHMGQTPIHMAAAEGSNGPEIIRLL